MSEYQYCEFRAVDRPLGKAELKRLRNLTTRAAISPTSFVNTYQWGELRAAASARAENREREIREKKEAERRRQEAAQAAARAAYLDRLAGREDDTWDKIGEFIATKRPNDYDRAIQLLIDLRDLATRDKREADFRFGLRTVREEHASKPSLQRRLNEAGLPDERALSLPLLDD